jgi:hypothetical protein
MAHGCGRGSDVFFGATRLELPVFAGDTYLCEAHEMMEGVIGHAVWLGDLTPARTSQERLVDSLLGYLSDEGVCCVILGFFPAYLARRFDDMPFARLYIASYG